MDFSQKGARAGGACCSTAKKRAMHATKVEFPILGMGKAPGFFLHSHWFFDSSRFLDQHLKKT
jgi:hypothetical protein